MSIYVPRCDDPKKFWDKLGSLPTVKTRIPGKAMKALVGALPSAKTPYRLVHRIAGLGSLGRQRFTALAEWNGGQMLEKRRRSFRPHVSGPAA